MKKTCMTSRPNGIGLQVYTTKKYFPHGKRIQDHMDKEYRNTGPHSTGQQEHKVKDCRTSIRSIDTVTVSVHRHHYKIRSIYTVTVHGP